MNKKFSTLMASALLATSVGAFAQNQLSHTNFATGDEILSDKYYVIEVADGDPAVTYAGVTQSVTGALQFKAIDRAGIESLAQVDSVLWSVEPVTKEGGFVRFILTNKATKTVFAFDKKNAVKNGDPMDLASATIGGNVYQWKWYDSRYAKDIYDFSASQPKSVALSMDFTDEEADSTMIVDFDQTSKLLYVKKDEKSQNISGVGLLIKKPGNWIMKPHDLNTQGDKEKYMLLSFAGDANENNPFAEKWQAQTITGTVGDRATTSPYYPYVTFINVTNQDNQGWSNVVSTADDNTVLLRKVSDKDELTNIYLHVDTSYYESKGNTYKLYNKLAENEAKMVGGTGSTYMDVDTLGANLPVDAYRFMFTKNLLIDSIKVETVSGFVEMDSYVTPKNQKKNTNQVTKYTMIGLESSIAAKFGFNSLAGSYNAPVISLSSGLVPTGDEADDVRNNELGFNVLSHCTLEGETTKVITFWSDDATRPTDNHVNLWAKADGIGDDYTSLEDGVYTIKDAETGEYLGVHIYADSVAYFTGGEAIANMNFEHIPAFQWVIWKNDRTEARADVSPVTIVNREFNDKNEFVINQLRKGEKEGQYIWGLYPDRELIIEKVSQEAVKDKYLGYKYVADDTLKVNRYTFNYWHSFNQDHYLALNANDTLLNVKTTDASRFKLVKNAEGNYGFNPEDLPADAGDDLKDLAYLTRRSYTVDLQGAGSIYSNKEDQYMITEQPAAGDDAKAIFYFKENNEFTKDNGSKLCYYALIDLENGAVEPTKAGVVDNDTKALLWQQVISETRTSVFAVEKDNAPLYRRFNSELLDGAVDNQDDTLLLRFKEMYVDDYLMDETNENFQREGMNYLGIGDKGIAEAGLSFIVRPFNIGKSAQYEIKPQYLVYVNETEKEGTDLIPCDATDHVHMTVDGKPTTNPDSCFHATPAVDGFIRYNLLVSFADSAEAPNTPNDEKLYHFGKYHRVGFVDAVEQDSVLYILGDNFKGVATADLDMEKVKEVAASIDLKAEVKKDNHHNFTWSFRYIDPAQAANEVEEDRAFLIESNVEPKGNDAEAIAPQYAAWLKNQNNCLVLSDPTESEFEDAKTGGDNALIFNIEKGSADDMATDNEEISTSEVVVIAGNGQITINGAAGKKVVVSNILGQVVANTVLTSDNATIAAPQGVVVVAVEGEEAVKAIVK